MKLFGFFLFIVFGYIIFFSNIEKVLINKSPKIPKILLEKNIEKEEKNKIISDNKIIDEKDKIKEKFDYKIINVQVTKNQTFLQILGQHIKSNKVKYLIINEVNKIFNLNKLKINQKIVFYKNTLNETKKIKIEIDFDTDLYIDINETIKTETKQLDKYIENYSQEFIIKESLYLDGINNKVPEEILIKIIRLFSFDLDFQRDIKKDTIVSFSYDVIKVNGKDNIKFEDINYALISIGNNKLEYFKFITDVGFVDYFNREGKNVKKSILKTPLDGAKLSSSFGMRKHPILGYDKMHKGIDFAAPKGTPIFAGGNGVIEYAGYNGSYGKYIRIRHNNEYKTAYAHLDGFKKGITKGVRVNQGQVIGFLGSTGRSTGPHLHYEIIFQNKQINPLKLKLPSGKILKGEELIRFKETYKTIYANHLNTLYE